MQQMLKVSTRTWTIKLTSPPNNNNSGQWKISCSMRPILTTWRRVWCPSSKRKIHTHFTCRSPKGKTWTASKTWWIRCVAPWDPAWSSTKNLSTMFRNWSLSSSDTRTESSCQTIKMIKLGMRHCRWRSYSHGARTQVQPAYLTRLPFKLTLTN